VANRLPHDDKSSGFKYALCISPFLLCIAIHLNTSPFQTLNIYLGRYAGIGGLSEVLGWTEVQQEEQQGFMGGVNGVLGLVALILAADLALFGYVTTAQGGVLHMLVSKW
jgi:hypothetical protein